MTTLPRQRSCLCGRQTAKPLFRELVACTACDLIYYPQLLAAEEIARLYGPDYFHGAEYFDYQADHAVHEMNFQRRVRQLARWLPRQSRVFEIGCSYGLFLKQAARYWSVGGCDIAAEPCQAARDELGLDVHCGDFLNLELPAGAVDAFCMWDTIEHLDRAAEYLARVRDLLRPGGLLALTTGDIGSWLAKKQGPRWRQIHPPTHIWYFSLATMQRTLNRLGFDMVWSKKVGMFRSLGQIVYSLTSLGRPEPAFAHRACMRLGVGRLPIWINTFDLMMVVARRRGGSTGLSYAA